MAILRELYLSYYFVSFHHNKRRSKNITALPSVYTRPYSMLFVTWFMIHFSPTQFLKAMLLVKTDSFDNKKQ